MKKKLLVLLVGVVTPFFLYSQIPQTAIVSVVSEKKDTLFLANNAVGQEIYDVWVDFYLRYEEEDRPIIIFKPEEWIITESKKREGDE